MFSRVISGLHNGDPETLDWLRNLAIMYKKEIDKIRTDLNFKSIIRKTRKQFKKIAIFCLCLYDHICNPLRAVATSSNGFIDKMLLNNLL